MKRELGEIYGRYRQRENGTYDFQILRVVPYTGTVARGMSDVRTQDLLEDGVIDAEDENGVKLLIAMKIERLQGEQAKGRWIEVDT